MCLLMRNNLIFHLVLIDNELKYEIIFHQTEIHQYANKNLWVSGRKITSPEPGVLCQEYFLIVLVCFSSAVTRARCEWPLRYMWTSSPRCGGINLLVFWGKVFRRLSLVGDNRVCLWTLCGPEGGKKPTFYLAHLMVIIFKCFLHRIASSCLRIRKYFHVYVSEVLDLHGCVNL